MADSNTNAESDPLSRLGVEHGTDKVAHGFCSFYDKHLHASRKRASKVLEIGVLGGSSLYMWRDYFPNAFIHGADTGQVNIDNSDRIATHVVDQQDRSQLQSLVEEAGSSFDLILDDGGHTMMQQQVSLGFLFPHVRPGGFYVVEDLHTSFMQSIGIYKNGAVVDHYDTGAGSCAMTTYEIIERISRNENIESDFMSDAERDYLRATVERAEIFDRNGDRQHMTCVIKKRSFSLVQRLAMKLLKKLLD